MAKSKEITKRHGTFQSWRILDGVFFLLSHLIERLYIVYGNGYIFAACSITIDTIMTEQ